ncbi:hypothetical protein Hanom_Chr09g00808791 [Helianthus anomalus]
MILPSPMEACTAILHPLPDQLLTPSSKSGFSIMLSSAAYTHGRILSCNLSDNNMISK